MLLDSIRKYVEKIFEYSLFLLIFFGVTYVFNVLIFKKHLETHLMFVDLSILFLCAILVILQYIYIIDLLNRVKSKSKLEETIFIITGAYLIFIGIFSIIGFKTIYLFLLANFIVILFIFLIYLIKTRKKL